MPSCTVRGQAYEAAKQVCDLATDPVAKRSNCAAAAKALLDYLICLADEAEQIASPAEAATIEDARRRARSLKTLIEDQEDSFQPADVAKSAVIAGHISDMEDAVAGSAAIGGFIGAASGALDAIETLTA